MWQMCGKLAEFTCMHVAAHYVVYVEYYILWWYIHIRNNT